MNADWNSFFSTLSQSAAAIVGIFGAFIITKIFSNQTVFYEKKAKLSDLLVQAQKIKDNARDYDILWYNDHYNRPEYRKFHEHLYENFATCESIEDLPDNTLSEFIFNNDFSDLAERSDIEFELRFIADQVFKENKLIREKRERDEKAEAEAEQAMKTSPLASHLSGLNIAAMAKAASYFSQMDMYGNQDGRAFHSTCGDIGTAAPGALTIFKDNFYKVYRDAKHHSRLSADFLTSVRNNPESPRQIGVALVLVLIIFFLGIIYPLSFIPAIGKPVLGFSLPIIYANLFSFKGFLLCVIGLAFSFTVALFFHTHIRMKYPKRKVAEVEKLTDVTYYCNAFKFLDDTE
ncbi:MULTISPECIES: hypothetical protein [unclassified Pseudomonas]|uniref:hypothetical protein n=1 Tax=unclassified Pseudomonas TaxID=196821 RepID=UPI000A1DE978|nr:MULTISPECIES: hypothetical protein [unclassified Pseudomonas]